MAINTNFNISNIATNIPLKTSFIPFRSSTTFNNSADTVEINGKKKTSLSNGAKWGIGLGILGTITLGIGLALKGNPPKAFELAEHIDFTEAKTAKEAIKWGKKHLGIKNYLDIKDVEVLNWINKGLVDVNNFMKGKAKMPSVVSAININSEYIASATRFYEDLGGHNINISRDVIKDCNSILEKNIKNLTEERLLVYENGAYKLGKIYSPNGNTKDIEELLNKFVSNKNSIHWNDKMALYESLRNIVSVTNGISDSPFKTIKQIFEFNKLRSITADGEKMTLDDISKLSTEKQSSILRGFINKYDNIRFMIRKASPYNTLYHEMGHIQHQYSAGLDMYNKMGKVKELDEMNITDKSIISDFLNDSKKQQVATMISTYSSESPCEFVAETFAELVNGNKISEEVKSLYREYKGPIM